MVVRMKMFLQLSALALLVSAAVFSPTGQVDRVNLNRIIELAHMQDESSFGHGFVVNVKTLVETCENEFFCKVYEVLHKQENFTQTTRVEEIVRNLRKYLEHEHVNCTELHVTEKSSAVRIKVSMLIGDLTECIQRKNLLGTKSSKP